MLSSTIFTLKKLKFQKVGRSSSRDGGVIFLPRRSTSNYATIYYLVVPVPRQCYGNIESLLTQNASAYEFLSACFRNLTNAINSTYYQAFTMRNVWESVVSEA